MTVAELIEILKQQPQDLQVVYNKWSEFCLVEADDVYVIEAGPARPDGWVSRCRPDRKVQSYLIIGV